MKYLLWLLKAAIFFTLFAFALNNQQDATVHFFFGTQWRAPLVLVVLTAFSAGLAVGVLGMVPRWWRHRTAARLGYLVGPTWVVAELEKVVLPYHLDTLKQRAGCLALDHVAEMEERVSHLVEERGRVETALRDLPCDVWESGANFILFRPRQVDGADVWQQLVDRSVLVRNCSGWPRLAGCLRVTIGTADEDDRFLHSLREILT